MDLNRAEIVNEQPEETKKRAETTAEDRAANAAARPEVVVEDAPREPTPEEQLDAEKEKFLRLAAEYDNFRKRSVKERETLYRSAKADTVTKLLPVFDNLTRALEAPCSDESFFKGVEMIMTQFMEILAGLGVEEIPAVGEKFDPERHDAVSQANEEDVESGVITAEFQKGFTLDKKVIRHGVVQVNT
ncbi:MAG: nucleotide exchange factor GrpE [Clostridiales bacterium]|nr:nucleotide exchange factor GrpE [Clostridiales bacterium]